MLKLEKMSLRGFKSFGEAAELRFRPGITAVVGPNGCGKSNIGDALNWVLGEQSAKMLRGQQMADVIFNGSEARKPLGLAEVTITFTGGEGLPGADEGQVAITRRLYRSGESEYLLNGAKSRLRDIQELLREGHVGARTYATIEQGKIDQVLNAKPRDRRGLIEDAAGISGYKHKRRLAELKLEATYANLLRVNDIVAEVARQINSLKRQAAKARRYRRLREDLRHKELVRFVEQARAAEAELEALRSAEASAHRAELAATAELDHLDAALAAKREALETGEREIREAAERLHRLELDVDRKQVRVRNYRERSVEQSERAGQQRVELAASAERERELAARRDAASVRVREIGERLEQLVAAAAREQSVVERMGFDRTERVRRIEELRRSQFESMSRATELANRIESMKESLGRNAERIRRLAAERAEAGHDFERGRSEATTLADEAADLGRLVVERRERQTELDRTLTLCRERQDSLVEILAGSREREKSAEAQLVTLEAVETRFAGVSGGVRALLAAGQGSGIRMHGVVADFVETSREFEAAAESYLRVLLPTVILEDDGDASRAAAFLRASGAGRTSLICRSQPVGALAVGSPGNGHATLPAAFAGDGRVLGRLSERVTLKTSVNGVLANRIGDALLVDTLETALELHRAHPAADYVTPQGEVVFASGVISTSGRPDGDAGLLAHKRRTEEVRRELGSAALRTTELQQELEAVRAQLSAIEIATRDNKQELEEGERRAMELELRVARSTDDTRRSERRAEVLDDELSALHADSASLEQTSARMAEERAVADRGHQEWAAALAQEILSQEEGVRQLEQQAEKASALRADRAVAEQLVESASEEASRLERDLTEIGQRLRSLTDEVDGADRAAREGVEAAERLELELARDLAERERLSAELGALEQGIEAKRAGLSEHEEELRGRRGGLDEFRARTRQAEIERTRAEAARTHLDDLCRQELGLTVAEAQAEPLAETEGPADVVALEAEIADIRDQIEKLGPVNMTAIEEFTELEERHEFLSAQKADLDSSMEALRESIKRIDRQSRQKFSEAFESIRQSYQEVYRLLFHGGRADLRLEEGEDVLECGIEILAQPPGKRLSGVHLLSGGEKALSAIALLFAIFRYQPSPFCLLDEVDAPLDDSNVARFTRMLTEYARNTQFIIVTHNKLSMEAADVLYGVTMQEPGVSTLVSLDVR